MCRLGRAGFHKFVVRDSAKQGLLTDYSHTTLLAFLPKHDETASGAIAAGYETRRGTHACKTAEMVILDEFARLHAENADQAWVLHLLYIVARGLPVTTAAVALSLRGRHAKRSNVIHSRTRTSDAQTDTFPKALHHEFPALTGGIKGVEQMQSLRWRVRIIENDEA